MSNNLEIIEDNYELHIQFRWFSPIAFFLLFFCIAWDAFLIFWYSTGLSSGDMPWIFFVFPLIHVAIGIGLSYYTLCLFLNKTDISVYDDTLRINHTPLPWWKGKKEIPTSELEQLYVFEKKNRGKNGGTSYTYALKAKLENGKDTTLISIGKGDSQMMQQIEQKIESFIGIQDMPVIGEFPKATRSLPTTATSGVKKKKIAPPSRPQQLQLQHLRPGDFLDYERTSYRVTFSSQYDWNNGNSDLLLQIVSHQNDEKLVYLEQNKGIYKVFLEDRLSLIESNSIFFLKAAPPESVDFEGQAYQLQHFLKGQQFLSDQKTPIETDQWIYLAESQNKRLRIIDNDAMISMYTGLSADLNDFDKLLAP